MCGRHVSAAAVILVDTKSVSATAPPCNASAITLLKNKAPSCCRKQLLTPLLPCPAGVPCLLLSYCLGRSA